MTQGTQSWYSVTTWRDGVGREVGGDIISFNPYTTHVKIPWKISWRRERLTTPVFWPGEFHELFGPWGRKESGMTERLSLLGVRQYLD